MTSSKPGPLFPSRCLSRPSEDARHALSSRVFPLLAFPPPFSLDDDCSSLTLADLGSGSISKSRRVWSEACRSNGPSYPSPFTLLRNSTSASAIPGLTRTRNHLSSSHFPLLLSDSSSSTSELVEGEGGASSFPESGKNRSNRSEGI